MNAFKRLLAKELRLGNPMFLIVLIFNILLIGCIVSLYPNGVTNEAMKNGATMTTFCLEFLYVVYLSLFLFYSLGKEARQFHQWLYNPQPMSVLLGTKLLSACIFFLLSMLITVVCMVFVWSPDILRALLPHSNLLFIASISKLCLISLALSMSTLLCWSIFRWLKPVFSGWVFFLLMGIFVVNIGLLMKILYMSQGFIYCFGLSIVSFLLSSYILDKKVEV